MPHRLLAFASAVCVAASVAAVCPSFASAGTFEVDACYPYTPANGGVFQHTAVFGINTFANCSSPVIGLGLTIAQTPALGLGIRPGPNKVPAGTRAYWTTQAPSGLRIVAAVIPQSQMVSLGVNDGGEWGGGFFWSGGGAEAHDLEMGFGAFMNSSQFGWQIVCGKSTCNGSPATLQVNQVRLFVDETGSPSITPTSRLYGAPGWIRGNGWPLSFHTDDPSGVCQTRAVVGGTVFAGGATLNPNHTVYHQCSVTSFSQTVNTANYRNGAIGIALEARNAGGNWATPSSTVHVDNAPVGLSLSGPTNVPSTAGTQFVTAHATAGPSGVSGIHCSLDGVARSYAASTVRIPVAGLGIHHLTCFAANNARNVNGQVATSAPQSWTLRIAEPTAATIAFNHGAQRKRVRYGRGATVSGTLATSAGSPLAGQPVTVYTAPDNGLQHFARAATAVTDANGAWRARIGAGPSRLVEAVYGGSATMESATSAPVRLTVPARLELRVRPRRVRWATRLTITGRLLGGYVPTDRRQASQLVSFRIGVVGVPGVHSDVGVPNLRPNGRFRTTFCLATGRGVVQYWFRAVTLYETDYPFARDSLSNRPRVTVGARSARHRACG